MTLATKSKKKERDLFSVHTNEGKKKNKKRKLTEDEAGSDTDAPKDKRKKRNSDIKFHVEPLMYKNLHTGQLILGCIRKILEYELIVSLPHKLSGIVPLNCISNSYSDMLKKVSRMDDDDIDVDGIFTLQELYDIGDFVVCKVIDTGKNDGDLVKMKLSINPEDVNSKIDISYLEEGTVLPCSVQSVEDEGFILDTGIKNVRSAFLSNNEVDSSNSKSLGVGSVMRCVVTSVSRNDDHTMAYLKLSATTKTVAKSSLALHDKLNMDQLIPGTKINTFVKKIHENVVELDLEPFEGVAYKLHLKSDFDLISEYSERMEVSARVLYVSPLSRRVHLTLNSAICSHKQTVDDQLNEIPIGHIIEEAEVYFCSNMYVYFKLSENARGSCIYEHKDKNNKFKIGSKHRCRVLRYSPMDRMFEVSYKQSIISKQSLGMQDLDIGKVLNVKIIKYTEKGATVSIDKGITGFIPKLHLTDSSMLQPELKYPVDSEVKARITTYKPTRDRIHLSCKSTIISSKLPFVTKCSEDFVGTQTHGTIVAVGSEFCIVELCNGVKGKVPKNLATTSNNHNLNTIFHVGQVIQCKVLQAYPHDKKTSMLLSFLIEGLKPIGKLSGKKQAIKDNLKSRQRVSGTVIKLDDDFISVKLDNGLHAKISVFHLDDDLEVSQTLTKCLKPGDKLSNLLILSIFAETIYLSLKQSFYNWIDDNEESILGKDLEVGEVVPSYVYQVTIKGTKLIIPKGAQGTTAFISNNYLHGLNNDSDEQKNFDIGKVLFLLCSKIDNNFRKLTPFFSKKSINLFISSFKLLHNYFAHEQLVRKGFINLGGVNKVYASYDTGDTVKGVVMGVGEYLVVVKLEEGAVGIIDMSSFKSVLCVGDKIDATVICVHFSQQFVELSVQPSIFNVLHRRINDKIKIGKSFKGRILTMNKHFAVAMLTKTNRGFAVYLPTKSHYNEENYFSYDFQKESSIVIKCIQDKVYGILKSDNQDDLIDFKATDNGSADITFEAGSSFNIYDTLFEDESILLHTAEKLVKENMHQNIIEYKIKKTKKIIERNASRKELNEKIRLLKLKLQSSDPDMIPTIGKKPISKKERRKQKKKLKQQLKELLESDISTIPKKLNIADKELKKNKKNNSDKNILSAKSKKSNNFDIENEPEFERMEWEEFEPNYSNQNIKNKLELDTEGFSWDVPKAKDSSSDEEEEDEDLSAKKKKKRMSKAEQAMAAKEEERKIHEAELKIQQGKNNPDMALDFEVILAKSPNSSLHWIQYVMFYLESAEIEKAKSIAQRAVNSIDKTMESEQLNVWTVYLKLIVQYGLPNEVDSLFKEANTVNCSFKIHNIMADIYNECNKIQEAEQLYHTMIKKFKSFNESPIVWRNFFSFLFQRNMCEKARNLLNNAVNSLPKKDHVDLINKFAQLEFKYGDAEKGCTAFESLVTNYFKRTDIWSVYVDMLVKHGDIDKARIILERMADLKLKLNKMRFIFKKFLDFEKTHGTEQNVMAVKERVQCLLSASLQ